MAGSNRRGRRPMTPPRPADHSPIFSVEGLYREVVALRELMETRLDAMERASQVYRDNLTRVPTETDKQISHLKELHSERFKSIEGQFVERDVRSQESAKAATRAFSASLTAQQEAATAQNEANAAAIAKSETATVKQIDSILVLLTSNTRAIDEKIGSISARLDRGEGGDRAHSSGITTAIALAAVFVSLLVGIFSVVSNHASIPISSIVQSPAAMPVPFAPVKEQPR